MQSLNILLRGESVTAEEYDRYKVIYESEYSTAIKELSKSKKDIKKGYLKFIDSIRCVRNEGLRRVSSETGFMSLMYKKIYKL